MEKVMNFNTEGVESSRKNINCDILLSLFNCKEVTGLKTGLK